MAPLSVRADVAAKTINEEDRTVELVFSTGAGVERVDWETGDRFIETLSHDAAHVRMDRLNQGAPLLDSHSAWSVADQLGTVVPGSAMLVKKEGRATVRFSRREAVEGIWQDVREGIIHHVSVGYRVYAFEEKPGKGGSLPVRKAVDWEPFEVSMVPIPADVAAMTRGARPAEANPCRIVTTRKSEETTAMDIEDKEASETLAERPEFQPEPIPKDTTPNERDLGIAAERARIQGLMLAARVARIPQSFLDKLLAEGVTLEAGQTRIFQELQRRGEEDRGPTRTPSGTITVGDDPLVHVREGVENAILHRVSPALFKLKEIGRPYRGMGLLDVARSYLHARGVRTTGLSKMDIAGVALGLSQRGGMHTTSDFALLLADVAAKTLRETYAETPQTFSTFGRRITLPDFKPSNRMQLGDAPALLEVKEHGEFTRGTITEGKEVFQLSTFGRVFAITRKALVNDDTDAFSRVPMMFGKSARTLESDLVWQQITSNPVMGDGVTLFHASHGNLDAAPSVISVASLGKGRAAMRVQKGIDGTTVLNLNPAHLALPAALETTAATFLVQITPQQPANVNPFAGVLTAIVEPRLDANSVTAWYLIAGGGADVIEYAYLEGEEGPTVESRIGFDIDGLEIKCRHDFAAKVIDWRGVWKNPGA